MSFVFDFVDIRSRMLGDNKPQPEKKTIKKSIDPFDCSECMDTGWVPSTMYTHRWKRCPNCRNVDSKECPTLPP